MNALDNILIQNNEEWSKNLVKYLRNDFIKPSFLQHMLIEIIPAVSMSRKYNVDVHSYEVDGIKWIIADGKHFKYTFADDDSYHDFFNKKSGFNARWEKNLEDDPEMCKLGPEIADIEIVTGSCPKINSENCRWCYKNNTSAPGKTMSLEDFRKIIMSFPKNLTQVALGITGVRSNPNLPYMLKWLREYGVVGNLTLTGADLDDEMADVLCEYCGACAVSCYDKAKDLCYSTIKKLSERARNKFLRNMSVNMHIVIADFSINHVMDVLHDIKDGKVKGLKSVVMLHAKPVGRAKSIDCSLSKKNLTMVVKYCLENNISFGFDSCNGHNVQEILSELGKSNLCDSIESCESSRMSIYVAVDGKMTPCSFVEHVYEKSAIDMLAMSVSKFINCWKSSDMLNSFRNCTKCSKSCPIYSLDCK